MFAPPNSFTIALLHPASAPRHLHLNVARSLVLPLFLLKSAFSPQRAAAAQPAAAPAAGNVTVFAAPMPAGASTAASCKVTVKFVANPLVLRLDLDLVSGALPEVLKLKQQIEAACGVPAPMQRLLFAGQLLQARPASLRSSSALHVRARIIRTIRISPLHLRTSPLCAIDSCAR